MQFLLLWNYAFFLHPVCRDGHSHIAQKSVYVMLTPQRTAARSADSLVCCYSAVVALAPYSKQPRCVAP